jgi:hypothetical protein
MDVARAFAADNGDHAIADNGNGGHIHYVTTETWEVYIAYAAMTGKLVDVDVGDVQTAPFDALASVDTVGGSASIIVGQASNLTSGYTNREYTVSMTITGLNHTPSLVRNGKVTSDYMARLCGRPTD